MAHFKQLLLVVNMPPNMSPNIPSTPNGLAVKSCEHPKHMAARWHLGVIRSILLGGIIPWIVTGFDATLARYSSPIYKIG
jgi:hypothetical protein